jgi:hypothetical protein
MSQHCRANPCCGDLPCSGIPLPQDASGLPAHNKSTWWRTDINGVPAYTSRYYNKERWEAEGKTVTKVTDEDRSALSTSQSDPAPEISQQTNMPLIQALSRLAGNRQSDGTSSLVSREDRETIINGCHDLLIASRRNPAPEIAALRAENERLQHIASAAKAYVDAVRAAVAPEQGEAK